MLRNIVLHKSNLDIDIDVDKAALDRNSARIVLIPPSTTDPVIIQHWTPEADSRDFGGLSVGE